MLTITVYGKPGCMACWATEQRLDATPFATADAGEPEAAALIAELGHLSAPVVVVRKNGEVVESWSGFNPDNLDRWSRAITGILAPVAA